MRSESRLMRKAEQHEVNREDIDVWDQTSEELSLDMRELLITDANVYFVGPDMDTYRDDIKLVADRLNYTFLDFEFKDMPSAARLTGVLEKIIVVPPLNSVTRFPWKVATTGLVVWIDPDGWKRWDVVQRDKVRKKKFPKKKSIFGPDQPTDFTLFTPKNLDAGDPIDMWQEADVHVDLQARPNMKVADNIMASVIDAILRSPPKWRNWMKAGCGSNVDVLSVLPGILVDTLHHRLQLLHWSALIELADAIFQHGTHGRIMGVLPHHRLLARALEVPAQDSAVPKSVVWLLAVSLRLQCQLPRLRAPHRGRTDPGSSRSAWARSRQPPRRRRRRDFLVGSEGLRHPPRSRSSWRPSAFHCAPPFPPRR